LWDEIKDVPMKNVASDYWVPYEDFVPAKKHLQTKRDIHGGGIQLPDSALFGKISPRDAPLFQKRRNNKTVPKISHAKTQRQSAYAKLTMPENFNSRQYCICISKKKHFCRFMLFYDKFITSTF
jgi:hypothetical protein